MRIRPHLIRHGEGLTEIMHPLLEKFGLYAIDHGMVETIVFEVRDQVPAVGAGKRRKHVIGVYYLPCEEIHVVALGTVSAVGDELVVVPVSPGTFDEEEQDAVVVQHIEDATSWLTERFRDQVEAMTLQAGAVGEA
jgi:hypothetical protein